MLVVRLLAALIVALAALLVTLGPTALARPGVQPLAVLALRHAGADFTACALQNATSDADGLRIADLSAPGAISSGGAAFGTCVSAPFETQRAFDQASGTLTYSGGSAELEVRASADGATWTAWQDLGAAPSARFGGEMQFAQYRVTLTAGPGGVAALVTAVDVDLADSGNDMQALSAAAKDKHPTVRVFATREGLVGRPTANGHMITDMDHFAALPSKSVLNPDGEDKYKVKVRYKDHEVTVPIWDIGPWNIKDNYWDLSRELFGDLPRYVPQALAAWRDGYNGGRDQYGRWVSFPSSIDLADGTYWGDLKMGAADWVDVTFLWVNDDSPDLTPKLDVYFKPPPEESTQSTFGKVWYFAEGSTKPPFDTWLLIQNPGNNAAHVTLTLMKTDGTTELRELTLAPTSRTSLSMNDMLPDSEFSTRVDSGEPVFVERAMYFRRDGHVSAGIQAPAKTWYMAEGSTQDPFDTWILIQNPGPQPANVTVTFMKEDGSSETQSLSVGPTSRVSLYANSVVQNAGFSTRVDSDQPLVVERTMYLKTPPGGGHGAPAVSDPSATWFFGEGNTRPGIDTWLLLQNPNDAPAAVTVTFYPEEGPPVAQQYTVPANARFSLYARQQLDNARFGMKVEADRPIVAERAMYFGDNGQGQKAGAHDSVGSTILSKTWYLPDGTTRPPLQENLLVCNPNGADAHLTLHFMTPDGKVIEKQATAPAQARITLDVNSLLEATDEAVQVTADQPIVVERSMYLPDMQGGTNSIGIPQP